MSAKRSIAQAVHYDKLKAADKLFFIASREGDGPSGTGEALTAFLRGLSIRTTQTPLPPAATMDRRRLFDPQARQQRQFAELVEFTQELYRRSANVRDKFLSNADRSSIDKWAEVGGILPAICLGRDDRQVPARRHAAQRPHATDSR